MAEKFCDGAQPEVLDDVALGGGRFICLKRLRWHDAHGVERFWEAAERVADYGAVLIAAWLRPSQRLLLIRQYRPPAGRYVYEFPAGLIDQGEDAETAARRELREETGYAASRITVMPAAYTTPGLTSESVYMVMAEIDETAVENQELQTEFDPSEDIETVLVPADEVISFYQTQSGEGHSFDAKVASYISALMFCS